METRAWCFIFACLLLGIPIEQASGAVGIEIAVVTEGFTSDAQSCGVTKRLLDARARLSLRQYDFYATEIDAKATNPFLFVQVNLRHFNKTLCAGSVDVVLVGYTQSDLEDSSIGWVRSAPHRRTVISNSASLWLFNPEKDQNLWLDSIEGHVKNVLGKVKY